MQRRTAWLVLCSCTFVLAGCSDDSSQADSGRKFDAQVAEDLTADTVGAGDVLADQMASRIFSGKVIDGTLTTVTAVPGAKVCILPDNTQCATSSSSGTFAISIPSAGEVALSVTAAGFSSLVFQIKAEDVSFATYFIPLSPTASTTLYFTAAGVTLDSSKGILSLVVTDSATYGGNPVPDVSFTVSPALGSAIVFMDATGKPDKTLTSTSAMGFGAAANVAPGDYQVTFSHATKSCSLEIGEGWPGTTKSSAKVRVIADHSTYLWLVCK